MFFIILKLKKLKSPKEPVKIFKMAPIHHHYELKGIPESKVVIRFWIVGLLFALLTITTFKIR